LLTLAQCKQGDPQPKTELEKLPPASQQGKNTLGCLVNGVAYTASGRSLSVQQLVDWSVSTVEIGTHTLVGGRRQNLSLGFQRPQTGLGTYSLSILNPEASISYLDASLPGACYFYSMSQPAYCAGQIVITHNDHSARIAAGTFEATIAVPGCDTVKITQGRFDVRF
jgi:hypothetical protein